MTPIRVMLMSLIENAIMPLRPALKGPLRRPESESIRNPESESIRNPESESIWNPESESELSGFTDPGLGAEDCGQFDVAETLRWLDPPIFLG